MVVFDHIAIGFAAVFTAHKLLYCFFGVFMGMLMGVLPGIGAMATISMLLPITFYVSPDVGLIMLAMVLRQVNLPVEGIALIIGVDRLLDMVRTGVNITGDATVTCIVAKSEGQLDQSVYQARETGAAGGA